MDRFEKKEMKKTRPIKNNWYNWRNWYNCLINYISKPIRKSVSLFDTNTPKQIVYGRGKKPSKPKIQNIKKIKKEQKRN